MHLDNESSDTVVLRVNLSILLSIATGTTMSPVGCNTLSSSLMGVVLALKAESYGIQSKGTSDSLRLSIRLLLQSEYLSIFLSLVSFSPFGDDKGFKGPLSPGSGSGQS